MKCKYIIGKGTDNEIVLEGREALLRHLNQTEGLDAAVSRYMTEVGKEDVGAVQEWVKKGISQSVAAPQQAEVAAQQEYDRSDAEIEKRMSEIEASTNESDKKEFSELEKEMEKRERDSVFSIPLQDVASAVDSLMTKEKEQPNGFGSFIEKKDAQETKAVAQKYSNPESITDEELKKDFTEALMGNPSTSYADGLLLRESLKEATKRGINTSEMFSGVENEFVKDGFTQEDAKSVVAERLRSIAPQSKQTALPETIPQVVEAAVAEDTTPVGQVGSETTVAEPTEVFTEIDTIIDLKGPDAVAARKDFKEKHGAEVYDKARRITREFNDIVEKLESEGKLKKVCP